jgi:hypothetical protein
MFVMSLRSLFARVSALAFVVMSVAPLLFAASTTVTEDFASDPLARDWEIHNDSSLFVWNSTNQNLEVTWDSSKTNSYFRLPIAAMTSEDNFSFALDLHMHELRYGSTEGRPSTFQFAFGFHHRVDADGTDFVRGTGANTPNLAEFNFMPDSGFGPTVWPAMFSTNGLMNYSGASDFGVFEIPVGVPLQVRLDYTATNHTLSLEILTNGVTVGSVVRAPLIETNIQMGFMLDAFSISSYSDEGQFEGPFQGSVFARGTIDNIIITLPATSPIHQSTGMLVAGKWQHEVIGEPGWNYTLEASTNLDSWSNASATVEGTGQAIQLSPTELETAEFRFFRVKATRI